jgi:hypothetical protein
MNDLKRCSKCNECRPLHDFALKKSARDGLQPYCRACQHTYFTRLYSTDEAFAERAKQRSHRIKRENRAYLRSYLEDHPCRDCGLAEIDQLEFDHVTGKKRANLSKLVSAGASIATLDAEIAKCEVRCVNCHRQRTTRVRMSGAGYSALDG